MEKKQLATVLVDFKGSTVHVSKCLLMGLQFLPDMIFVTIGATGGGVKFLLTLDHQNFYTKCVKIGQINTGFVSLCGPFT